MVTKQRSPSVSGKENVAWLSYMAIISFITIVAAVVVAIAGIGWERNEAGKIDVTIQSTFTKRLKLSQILSLLMQVCWRLIHLAFGIIESL